MANNCENGANLCEDDCWHFNANSKAGTRANANDPETETVGDIRA